MPVGVILAVNRSAVHEAVVELTGLRKPVVVHGGVVRAGEPIRVEAPDVFVAMDHV